MKRLVIRTLSLAVVYKPCKSVYSHHGQIGIEGVSFLEFTQQLFSCFFSDFKYFCRTLSQRSIALPAWAEIGTAVHAEVPCTIWVPIRFSIAANRPIRNYRKAAHAATQMREQHAITYGCLVIILCMILMIKGGVPRILTN